MSWRASAWAKEQIRYLGTANERLLLMVLAEYAHPENQQAWPNQTTLADVCSMTTRHVVRCINSLTDLGLITRLRKGNQHQPSLFQLNLSVSLATIGEGDKSESDKMSPSPESDISNQVKVTSGASESDIPVGTNLQEPPREPPEEGGAVFDEYAEVIETLHGIDGWVHDTAEDRKLVKWLTRKSVDPDHAEAAAIALASKVSPHVAEKGRRKGVPQWRYAKADGRHGYYTNLWATYKTWARRDGVNGRTPTSTFDPSKSNRAAIEAAKAEQQRGRQ